MYSYILYIYTYIIIKLKNFYYFKLNIKLSKFLEIRSCLKVS